MHFSTSFFCSKVCRVIIISYLYRVIKQNNMKNSITNLEKYAKNSEFLYMLLSRLQFDCKAALSGSSRSLWGVTVEDHINETECIYDYLEPKPQWITVEEIEFYEKEMK